MKLTFTLLSTQLYRPKLLINIIFLIVFTPSIFQAQISPLETASILRRVFNHDMTYQVAVKYICQDLLNVEHDQLVDATINTITSAKSGELTTIVYHSDKLNKQGLVLTFWKEQATSELFNTYDGYAFRTFDLKQANTILTRLSQIMEDKKLVLEDDNHAVFQFEDVTFVFKDRSKIFVCWDEFRSDWTTSNLKTTINRVSKFLKKRNG